MGNELAGDIRVKASTLGYVIVLAAVLAGVLSVVFFRWLVLNAYAASLVLTVLVIGWGAWYFYQSHRELNEMCCMMNGMVFAMMASFVIGVIVALPTGEFVLGIIVGTLVGFVVGIPLGRLGGHLGRMEGIMAAPMGGSMGAMLGVMIRFYQVQVFMQFLLLVLLFVVVEMTRVNKAHRGRMPTGMVWAGAVLGILMVVAAAGLNFSVETGSGGLPLGGTAAAKPIEGVVPITNGVQELSLKMERFGYVPDRFAVKKGVPVRIQLQASRDAGCTRSIVFPDFGVSKVVPAGGTDTITFTPQKEGTFGFRCSMAMARGTMVVTA